jgi:hypothetical protein
MKMISGDKGLVLAALLGLTLLFTAAASAQTTPYIPITPNDPRLKTNMFDYEYVLPENPAHMKLYELFKKEHLLERFVQLLSPLRLPVRIKLHLEGCNGKPNAYFVYDDNEIKVCYEYFQNPWSYGPDHNPWGYGAKTETKGQTISDNIMLAAAVEVLMHELGHAMVEVLDIPFIGREEDVADYIGIFLLLKFDEDDALRLFLDAPRIGGNEAMKYQSKGPRPEMLANSHSLPAQRFFNRLCMAYGKDPKLFADAIGPNKLPEDRAKNCGYEYRTNAYALKTLLLPYVDQDMMKKVISQHWFRWQSSVGGEPESKPVRNMTDQEKKPPSTKR